MGIIWNDSPVEKGDLEVDLCLFDLDGTIVNTIEASESAWKSICSQYDVDPEELFKFSHGTRTVEVLNKFFPKLDNTDNKAVKMLEMSIATDYKDQVHLVPGSKDLLLSLDRDTDSGEIFNERKWAIVTSGSPYCVFSWFENILEEVGKPKAFVTSFDVTNGKPDPEGYLLGKKQLCDVWDLNFDNTTSTVVFEDAPVGIKAGKAMGAYTIGITSSYDKNILFDAGADFVVEDLTHVSVVKNTKNGKIILKISNPLSKD
ncbi:hypothetical protein Kpol_1033p5 [Vanderwaltozyma polyspora DSM 70294]|uniref:Uncharacterized protein n=1 Tax=Vanderwaltozyma polyspora (strain ATCC 22028 / DSM 70294 / BCRC 21397 / CBS 2163 / NBRC 10782 / NRRL Y-8283 / UCD 57-17) TaxID=436907 RepID=A7TJ03_VANPO|nr:uncharacterized protein Kpol_1033p5 [Vanderwaltozyma polyspora DSM 70294]EDO17702.1 hypothetical protein Kpol_1033p5 [Vanderwaltozyma polyspora DSM 70294]